MVAYPVNSAGAGPGSSAAKLATLHGPSSNPNAPSIQGKQGGLEHLADLQAPKSGSACVKTDLAVISRYLGPAPP